jgi:hypothetical protein
MYQSLILIMLGYIFTYILQNMIRKLLIETGQVVFNFQGIKIPTSMGIAIILSTVLVFSFIMPFGFNTSLEILYIVYAGCLMGFVGIIDDFFGDSLSKGFKGHIINLIKGKLTTGGLKAIMGIVASYIISLQVSTIFYELVVNVLLISLTTNFINLLDTRPGRAIKGFSIFTFLLFLMNGNMTNIQYIVLGALVAYLPLDLKAKGMLGDTGSNFIGIVLGASMVITIENFVFRVSLLIIVLLLNFISEKYSFSKMIETNKILSFIDHLGRDS